jgi:UDP-2,4-diacetamido-2,4,6-trideoxy-beta-L-altropyranose hydrolase
VNKKVLIRVDGSTHIGLGHVVRCIALAHMLKKEFHIHFFSKEIPDSIIREIILNDFEFTKIETEETFFKILTGKQIVVLDNYFFDTAYQKKIKEISDCKLVCIDDLHDREFYADLIINHAPGVKQEDYKAQPYTQFALGLDYALLRPVFLEQAHKSRIINNKESLFICFGGSDFNNLTHRVLQIASKFKEFKRIIVVTGAAYTNIDSLSLLVKTSSKVENHSNISGTKMLALMAQSDVAIVPSSGVLLEVISAGCYVISGTYIENQKYAFQTFKDQNIIISAESFSEESIQGAIEKVLYTKVQQTKKIDGNQKSRLIAKINSLYQPL